MPIKKGTKFKTKKIPFYFAKMSKCPNETESPIIKSEIKTEIKIEALDYGDQSVWNSIKVPENAENIYPVKNTNDNQKAPENPESIEHFKNIKDESLKDV